MMLLSEVCRQVQGVMQGTDVSLQNVSINTREDCQHTLFVALKGENFDAHNFIDQAEQAGANALMIEREVNTTLPSVTVPSTHQALKQMAAWWRSRFDLPLIGVTGSVGKTSVKEMLGSIFAELGQGVVTKGNLNNEIGVPLTLMRLTADDKYAVIEMGMNAAGEIARLTQIARPTIALVNNAAAAHLEGLGSIEAVARAKGEIFSGLTDDGIAVINNEDDYASLWHKLAAPHTIVTFGLFADADVTATYRQHNGRLTLDVDAMGQHFSVRLHTVGQHNVRNALAAVAVSMAAEVPVAAIKSGLAAYRPAKGRLNIKTMGDHTVIDDTYNANPASMRAAIKVLMEYQSSNLIIGDMAELGASAQQEHQNLGVVAASAGIEHLYVCGEYAEQVANGFGDGARVFTTRDALIEHLHQSPPVGATLVKGSRSAGMEEVVVALESIYNNKNTDSQRGDQ